MTLSQSSTSCAKACDIWVNIFSWWGINWVSNGNISDLLQGNSGNLGSDLGNDVWQAVLWTCCYLIWKNRNEKVFKYKGWNVPVAVREIQVKSFEWISKRCKTKHLDWHNWLHTPPNCFI
ncbi:uncharacterized protein [Rutidosis leptorrhynchoides]|uniref:uncharacterized protein n=1 Tax=Rutidosis leptorrhynchoides TaxID=125765 RepID=UPI003A99CE68